MDRRPLAKARSALRWASLCGLLLWACLALAQNGRGLEPDTVAPTASAELATTVLALEQAQAALQRLQHAQAEIEQSMQRIARRAQVTAPLGQYDNSKVVNLGTNRWSFKHEVGVSKAFGPWILEATAAATLYTDNTDFFNGNTRAQRPLYSFEGHAIYSFTPGIWGSLDVTYFNGGRTSINDTLNNDLQQNWRLGGTLSFPVSIQDSVKLYASSGVSARTGNDFHLIGIAWQYRWGAGL